MDQKVIDSHFHIFDLNVRDSYPNQNESHGFPPPGVIGRSHSLQELEKTVQECGSQVLGGVFVQCYNDCPEEIEWVYSQAKQSNKLLGVVGGLDLTKHDKMREMINKYKGREEGHKFLGVRYLLAWDKEDFMLREDALKGLQILAENNLTFDWHTPTSGPFSTIKNIPEVAKKIPELKIVINHIAKPFGSDFNTWADEITKASKFKNVYCKLSGLNDEVNFYSVDALRPYVKHCLESFGPDRCMFGSDWPVCKMSKEEDAYATQIALLKELTAHLNNEEKDNVFYKTAEKFYGLFD